MIVTPLYGALLALLFVFLSAQVILARRSCKVSLGDGGQAPLRRAIRAQGNCAEYAPLALLLMILVESLGSPKWQVHMLGALLLFGRATHAYALTRPNEVNTMRIVGMALTFTAIISGAVMCLVGLHWSQLI